MRASCIFVLLLVACGGGGGGGDDGDDVAIDAASSAIDGAPGLDAAGGCGTTQVPVADITGTEGIAIAADGTVYYSQLGHVGRWVPGDAAPDDDWVTLSGTRTVWGMAIADDGTLYVATPPYMATPGTIWSIDTTAATPSGTVLDDEAGQPNGLTLGPDGAIYYSNFSGDEVWRVTTEGARAEVTASAIDAPNGLLFDDDGTLLVASYQTGVIHRLTLDGAHQETGRVNALTGTGSPDGLARDSLGRVYVTDNGGGEVLRFEGTTGTPILMNVGAAANMAFGRGELACTDLYVTSSGALRRIDAGASGVP